jgi:glycosyltransferase involved in cell wall biosynthesis
VNSDPHELQELRTALRQFLDADPNLDAVQFRDALRRLVDSPLDGDTARLKAALYGVLGEGGCAKLGLVHYPPDLKLSVVIPVYNERRTIQAILQRVLAVPVPKEIVVVDDFSTDGTRELLQEIERQHAAGGLVRVIYQPRNRGKGAALKTGFLHVTGSMVIVQDADLEYNPAEYPALIQPIIDGRADVVFGSRFIGETHRVLFFWHYVANRFLTTFSNMLTNLNLTDMETCYKVFRRDVIDAIAPTLKSNRFGFEPEVTAKVAKRRYRVYELPVSYSGRDYSEGKKITWKDLLPALWAIVRFRFRD